MVVAWTQSTIDAKVTGIVEEQVFVVAYSYV